MISQQEMLLWVMAWVLAGGAVAYYAAGMGRNVIAWAIFGFMMPLLAAIALWIVGYPKFQKVQLVEPVVGDTKECPFCAEIIKKKAIKCKHCGADIQA